MLKDGSSPMDRGFSSPKSGRSNEKNEVGGFSSPKSGRLNEKNEVLPFSKAVVMALSLEVTGTMILGFSPQDVAGANHFRSDAISTLSPRGLYTKLWTDDLGRA